MPLDRDFILEGLHYEQPSNSMIGKRIQLLFDLSQSSLITHACLDSYELSPFQMSIEECLAIEEEQKSNSKFETPLLNDRNCYTDESDLPLIGSCEHALSLASHWTGGKDTEFSDVTDALVWRLPSEVKAAGGPCFSSEESQRLYTLQDVFSKMPGSEVSVIGQLKNVMMVGPDRNVNT